MQSTKVVKRTGEMAPFDASRIRDALTKAVDATDSKMSGEDVDQIVAKIVDEIDGRFVDFFPNVENIQDMAEKHLFLAGQYDVAKAYILYRAERQQARAAAVERAVQDARMGKMTVIKRDGRTALLNLRKIEQSLERAQAHAEPEVDTDLLIREVIKSVYDGLDTSSLERAMVLAATSYIERDPGYDRVATRLMLQRVGKEVFGKSVSDADFDPLYRQAFLDGIQKGVQKDLFDRRLLDFDLDYLASNLRPERDLDFHYLGVQTLYDRYFTRCDGKCIESAQAFWMRVSMGLCLEEEQPEHRVLEFYNMISQLHYIPSTPTLFHSGTSRPQLSSCYLTTISDDLGHIFKSLGDNAQLSKWSGGLGNDWTSIRATGAQIASTNVESQGVVPFLKIANDVTTAINRSGKRRGAVCAYLEAWHYDFEDFLDLRRNTGDERRRTHDMNTAAWIPDLFMKRVLAEANWTLFSPDEVPELHEIYGREFEARYVAYEAAAERGEIHLAKTVPAKDLWRKLLTRLFETGHPWVTFKDPCNIRSPQDHVGVIHSSNLCTEITLNTSETETAVCNLGSVNLSRHITDGVLDQERLAATVSTAVRMLDNVININFYPTVEARDSNLKHRPVGLGVMGFQDVLFQLGLPFESSEALRLADQIQETVSYHAILTSSKLAAERGTYPSYEGSKWDRGLFPIDTLDLLEKERGVPIGVPRTASLDWEPVRQHVAEHGMRNSNVMAIAPTATISNIAGCLPCIEPAFKNIYVKANISGEFTIVNRYLVEELKELGLWSLALLEKMKAFDGDLSEMEEIPDQMKAKYKEAFAIDPIRCLQLTAVRAKWIDQSQSHNVFIRGTSGKLLNEVYTTAWKLGLKTTYYLRSLGATQIEKSTVDAARYGYTQKRTAAATVTESEAPREQAVEEDTQRMVRSTDVSPSLCRIDDPDCESCQ